MAGSLAQLQVKITGDTADVSRKLAGLSRDIDRFSTQTERLGSNLFQAFTVPIVALGGLSLKAAAEFDSLKRGLTTVTGSAAEAELQFARLKEVAKLPGLGFREVLQGSINLQAAGFTAERAERSIKAFGNALVSVGKGRADLDGVILALTQMQNKSSGIGQELRQLSERLPQLRKILTIQFGTGDSEEIAKLGFTSDQVIERILAGFEKIPKVTGGIGNSFENLKDQLEQTAVAFGSKLIPFAERAIAQLTTLLDVAGSAAEAFGRMPPAVQDAAIAITGLLAAAGPLTVVFGKLSRGIAALSSVGALGPGAVIAGAGVVLSETSRQLDDLTRRYDEAAKKTKEPLFSDFKSSEVTAQLNDLGITVVRTGQNVGVSSDQIKRAFAALEIRKPFGQIQSELKAAETGYATLAQAAKQGAVSQGELVQAGLALAKMQAEANAALGVAADRRRFLTLAEEIGREETSRAEAAMRKTISALTDFVTAGDTTGKRLQLFAEDIGTADFAVANLVERLQLLGTSESGLQRLFEVESRIAEIDLATPFERAREALKQTLVDTELLRLRMEEAGRVQINIQPVNQENATRGTLLETQRILDGIGVRSQTSLRAEADRAGAAYARLQQLARDGAASVNDVQRAYEAWREAEQAAVSTAGKNLARQNEFIKAFGRQVSLAINDTARGIVDIIGNADQMGAKFKAIANEISRSILRLIVEEGLNVAISQVGKLISRFVDLGQVFGGVAAPAASAGAQAAGGIGSAASGAGGIATGLSSGLAGIVTAATSAVSAIFDVLQFTQLRRIEQDVARTEVTSRGILNQAVSIQATLNQWLPFLQNLGTPGGGGGGNGRSNVTIYIQNPDPKAILDAITPVLRRAGLAV